MPSKKLQKAAQCHKLLSFEEFDTKDLIENTNIKRLNDKERQQNLRKDREPKELSFRKRK